MSDVDDRPPSDPDFRGKQPRLSQQVAHTAGALEGLDPQLAGLFVLGHELLPRVAPRASPTDRPNRSRVVAWLH